MSARSAHDLERLANGVLWPGFLGTTVPEWMRDALENGLAGVVYFGQNLGGDLRALSDEIHRLRPEALIGIDEEGGNVTRLEAVTGSTLPGAAQLGALDDADVTTAVARELGRRCADVGVDVVLAPVADVNTDPRNLVIGVRSFGSDPSVVSRHIAAFVRGLHAAGLAACAKHYPGHGDTHQDSHHDLPTVDLPAAEMQATHLPPFHAAIEAGVDAIMTAHIRVPAWGDAPATLNPGVLSRLRHDGFDGVIVTDALDMAAIRETVGLGTGAVMALSAGADLLCIGNPTNPGPDMLPDQDAHDFRTVRDAVVAAMLDGRLAVERVEEAGARVARMSASIRATGPASPASEPEPGLDLDEIVARAISVRGRLEPLGDAPTTVIDIRRRSTLAVDSAGSYVALTLAAGGELVRLDAVAADADTIAAAEARAREARSILLVDRLDAGSPQLPLARAVIAAAPETPIVDVGLGGGVVPGAITVIDARAASLAAARAVRRILTAV